MDDPVDDLVMVNAQPVTLLQEGVMITLNHGITKCVTYQDFIDILIKASDSSSRVNATTFQFPDGVTAMSISSTSIQFNMYRPGGVSSFKYEYDSDIDTIVSPNTLLYFSLAKEGANWKAISVKYMCTSLPRNRLPVGLIDRPNTESGIYRFPFSNTYDDNRMCYGSNVMPVQSVGDDLRRYGYYYDFLWTTPFNDDLGVSTKVENGGNVSKWYKELNHLAKDNKPFPYERMIGYTATPQ